MIVESFETAGSVTSSFVSGICVGTFVVLLVAAAFLLGVGGPGRKKFLKPIAGLSVACILAISASSYFTTFSRFIAMEAGANGIRLQFAGSFGQEVFIRPDEISDVLFGLPGKSDRQCYVKIQLKSGRSYRRTSFNRKIDACKQLRQDIFQMLRPDRKALL
jgi:hypothetical protein